MHSDTLKTWVSWTGLSMAVVLFGLSLHSIVSQILPDLLGRFFPCGATQIEILNTLWNCLG